MFSVLWNSVVKGQKFSIFSTELIAFFQGNANIQIKPGQILKIRAKGSKKFQKMSWNCQKRAWFFSIHFFTRKFPKRRSSDRNHQCWWKVNYAWCLREIQLKREVSVQFPSCIVFVISSFPYTNICNNQSCKAASVLEKAAPPATNEHLLT